MPPEKQTGRWQLPETIPDPLQEILDRKDQAAQQEMLSSPTKHGMTKKTPQFYEDMAWLRDWCDKYYRDLMLLAMLVELVLLAYIAFK